MPNFGLQTHCRSDLLIATANARQGKISSLPKQLLLLRKSYNNNYRANMLQNNGIVIPFLCQHVLIQAPGLLHIIANKFALTGQRIRAKIDYIMLGNQSHLSDAAPD